MSPETSRTKVWPRGGRSLTEEHIPLLRAGDPATMNWFFNTYGKRWNTYLRNKGLLPPDTVSDVTTDALFAVFQRLSNPDNPFEGNPDAYVCVAISNRLVDELRKKGRTRGVKEVPLPHMTSPSTGLEEQLEFTDPSDPIEDIICLLDLPDKLAKIRARLPEGDYQTVFDLLLGGCSSDDVANMLNKELGAGRVLCTRVRKRVLELFYDLNAA